MRWRAGAQNYNCPTPPQRLSLEFIGLFQTAKKNEVCKALHDGKVAARRTHAAEPNTKGILRQQSPNPVDRPADKTVAIIVNNSDYQPKRTRIKQAPAPASNQAAKQAEQP